MAEALAKLFETSNFPCSLHKTFAFQGTCLQITLCYYQSWSMHLSLVLWWQLHQLDLVSVSPIARSECLCPRAILRRICQNKTILLHLIRLLLVIFKFWGAGVPTTPPDIFILLLNSNNLSINGELLSLSQFTKLAQLKKYLIEGL